MVEIKRDNYTLLLGESPCEIFEHFGVEEMHGLNYNDCVLYPNNKDDAYIWGLANYVPQDNKGYKFGDKRFVFINLQRCADNYQTYGGVFHELMHHSLEKHNYNMDLEEEIISWAENESHEVFELILKAYPQNNLKYIGSEGGK
jgi:hypothetical protein